jgi:hypothetical protein
MQIENFVHLKYETGFVIINYGGGASLCLGEAGSTPNDKWPTCIK